MKKTGGTQFALPIFFSVLSLIAYNPVSASSAVDDTLEICGAEWPDYDAWKQAFGSKGWIELSRQKIEDWVPSFIIGFPGYQIENLLENNAILLRSHAEIELSEPRAEHLNVQGPTWWGHSELNQVALRSSTQKAPGQNDRLVTCMIVSRNAGMFDDVVAQPGLPNSEFKDDYSSSQIYQWKLANDRTISISKRTFTIPDDLKPSLGQIWPSEFVYTVTFWTNQ